jgi:hypothetical protein
MSYLSTGEKRFWGREFLKLVLFIQTPNYNPDEIYRPFINKIRSSVSNNLILPDSSSINRFQESSVPTRCHGPLCKSFICYIGTLPIGHSVLIQLKAVLRFDQFQSVSYSIHIPIKTPPAQCLLGIEYQFLFHIIKHPLQKWRSKNFCT